MFGLGWPELVIIIVVILPIIIYYVIKATRRKTLPTPTPTSSSIVKEKEVITREVVMIPCAYCRGLMPQTSTFCPSCGARRKA